MLTTDEQEKLVRLLDTNEQIRSNVETLIGRKIDSMKFGERLTAVVDYMELGRSLAPLTAATRVINDLGNLAADRRGDVGLADKVSTLEAQNDALRDQLKAATEQAKTTATKLMNVKAESARAVNSGERVNA